MEEEQDRRQESGRWREVGIGAEPRQAQTQPAEESLSLQPVGVPVAKAGRGGPRREPSICPPTSAGALKPSGGTGAPGQMGPMAGCSTEAAPLLREADGPQVSLELQRLTAKESARASLSTPMQTDVYWHGQRFLSVERDDFVSKEWKSKRRDCFPHRGPLPRASRILHRNHRGP